MNNVQLPQLAGQPYPRSQGNKKEGKGERKKTGVWVWVR